MSGEGRLCHFRSAVRWVWFVGVPVGVSSCCIYQCSGSLLLMVEVRIVSLCLHPRVALLGSGRCWIAHCWIGLRIELPCHYYSHGTTGIIAACWNAKSSQYSNWQVNSGINVLKGLVFCCTVFFHIDYHSSTWVVRHDAF